MKQLRLEHKTIVLPPELNELKAYPNWVCWKYVYDPNTGRYRKPPYNPVTGKMAAVDDPKTWVTFDQAIHAYESRSYKNNDYDGIGFMLGNTGHAGTDLDNCVIDGEVMQEAKQFVEALGSYAEFSPTDGLHILAKCAQLEKTAYTDGDPDFIPEKQSGDLNKIEIYRPREKQNGKFAGEIAGGRYFTITGHVYGDPRPIKDCTGGIRRAIEHYWPGQKKVPPVGSGKSTSGQSDTTPEANRRMIESALKAIPPENLDFNGWASICTALKYEGFSAEDAENWSSADGHNYKHVPGYVFQRWDKFNLSNPEGAGGIIINRAKEYGWNPGDAFTPAEKRQYAQSHNQTTPEEDFKAETGKTGSKKKPPVPPLRTENVRAVIQDLGFSIRLNIVTNEYEIGGKTPEGRRPSIDDLTTIIRDATIGLYRSVTRDTIEQSLVFIARENGYNPTLDLLETAIWDGTDRLPQLYKIIGIQSADTLSRTLVHKWLLQTVALLFNDEFNPFGADGCLVLNGPQGYGKTSLFRHLALRSDWFEEGAKIDDKDKDTIRRALTSWIAELGEVETTLKGDIDSLKNFITSATTKFRLPYARGDTQGPRHTSLCATCNSDRYLVDPTGNRRWWSVPFQNMRTYEDVQALDALQLWAQIYAEVKPLDYRGKSNCFRLTPLEREQLNQRNQGYEKALAGQEDILDILAIAEERNYPRAQMTISEFKLHWPQLNRYTNQQLGAALTKCGIEATRDGRNRRRLLPKNGL